jgi:hypothetical protein
MRPYTHEYVCRTLLTAGIVRINCDCFVGYRRCILRHHQWCVFPNMAVPPNEPIYFGLEKCARDPAKTPSMLWNKDAG